MLRKIIKGSLSILSFKIVGTVSNVLLNLIIARKQGAEALGEFNLFTTTLLFISILGRFGLDLHIIKVIPQIRSDMVSLKDQINNAINLVIIGNLIIGGVIILSGDVINQLIFDGKTDVLHISFLAISILTYSLLFFFSSIYRGFGFSGIYSFYQNMLIPTFSVVLLAITIYFHVDVKPIVIYFSVIVLGSGLSYLAAKRILAREYGHTLELISFKRIEFSVLKRSSPMIITTSSIFIMTYLSTYFISYFHGVHEVGLYSAVMKLSMPFAFLSGAVSSYIAPNISREHFYQNTSEIKKIYSNSVKILVLASSPILLIYLIFPEFLLSLFGEEYISQKSSFIVYCLSIFMSSALFGPVGYFLVMTENQNFFQRIMIFSLLLNLVMNYFLIQYYNTLGAAISTLMSTILWKLGSFLFLKRKNIL